MDKIVCKECDFRGYTKDALKAKNPFDETDTIFGCPTCKSPNSFRSVCDELDCWREVSSGTPTKNGYRSTCHQHAPKAKP